MAKDQRNHFERQISPEARKVTGILRNGWDSRGMSWNEAYEKGKVTNKDDRQIRSAAHNTRLYMKEKYGEDLVKAFGRSDEIFGKSYKDIKVNYNDLEKLIKYNLNTRID